MASFRRPGGHDSPASLWERLLRLTVASSLVALPLVFAPHGEDTFRLPKELVFRIEAILLAALLVSGTLLRQIDWSPLLRRRHVATLLLATLIWSGIATLFSTNRAISLTALAYGLAAIVVFAGAFLAADHRSARLLLMAALAGSGLNAVVAVMQATGAFEPFVLPDWATGRMQVTGLFGNPSDVGAYLVIFAIPTLAAALTLRSPGLWIMAGLLSTAVIATQSLTATMALVAAMVAMAAVAAPRKKAVVVTAAAAVAIIGGLMISPIRHRLQELVRVTTERQYHVLTSFRIVPVAAAWNLFLDHPVTGAGPGTFKWHYLPYRFRTELENPDFYLKNLQNYGAVHCDHMQLLAEAGLPAYGLFVVWLGFLSAATFRPVLTDGERWSAFTRVASFPFAVTLFVLTLSFFPLELPALLNGMIIVTAVLTRWTDAQDH